MLTSSVIYLGALAGTTATADKTSLKNKDLCYGHYFVIGFLVSKETVVLRRLERLKQKLGFIRRVDKG